MKLMHDENAQVSIGDLLGALLVIVVGLALTPTVSSAVNDSTDALGSDSAAGNLVELMTLFYVLIIIGGAVSYIVFKARA